MSFHPPKPPLPTISLPNTPLPSNSASPNHNNLLTALSPTHDASPSSIPIDWYGPDDPANPRNFPVSLRIFSTLAVTLLAFVSTLAASIYSPAIPDIRRTFNVSEDLAILPISIYNLGMAFGPLVGAPLSETFGRKVVFLATAPVFGLFVLASGFAQSIGTLVVCRFFAGMFAAPAVGNASATITDFTPGRWRGVMLGFYYSVPTTGAVLGPLIGGFVVLEKSWRWTQWTTLFFLLAGYAPIPFTRETYKPRILSQRVRAQLTASARAELHLIRRSLWDSIVHFTTTLLVRPVHMLLTEPIVTLVCTYSGFLFGLLYTFVVASPWVYEAQYAFSPSAQALSFLGLIIGAALAPLPLALVDTLLYQPKLRAHIARHGEMLPFPPEHRLYAALLGSLTLPTSLLAFAWTAHFRLPVLVPLVFQGLAMLSSTLIYAPVNLFMLDAYGPLYGASASGAAMLTRYLLSAAFPLFGLRMYKALGVGWATSLLAFVTVAMAPIPWLFWRFGGVLRKRGKYEVSS